MFKNLNLNHMDFTFDNIQETEAEDHNNNIYQFNITSYEQLDNYPTNINILQLMRNISNVFFDDDNIITDISRRNEIFHAIEELRKVRKFMPELFNTIFENIIEKFCKILNFSNIPITRLCLSLISEIFLHSKYEDCFHLWIKKMLPKILQKSLSEIQVIKDEAIVVLKNLVDNMLYAETIEVLLDNSCNKNQKFSNISFYFLLILLDNFDKFTLYQTYEMINWTGVLQSIVELYYLKKESYVKKAFKMLEILEQTFNMFYEYNHFALIISQLEENCKEKFDEMIKERGKFFDILIIKQESRYKRKSTCSHIQNDKRRSLIESQSQIHCTPGKENFPVN